MNESGQFMIPIFLPSGGDDKPEKVTCPKCKHEFRLPDDDYMPLAAILPIIFLLGGGLIFIGCIGFAMITDSRTEWITYIFGGLLIGIPVTVIIGFILDKIYGE